MNDLREAARLALEALEEAKQNAGNPEAVYSITKNAITSIRAALEQPAQDEFQSKQIGEVSEVNGCPIVLWDKSLPIGTKLYTFPPQRQPLTEDERLQLRFQWIPEIHGPLTDYLIQKTEAAHGIKGGN